MQAPRSGAHAQVALGSHANEQQSLSTMQPDPTPPHMGGFSHICVVSSQTSAPQQSALVVHAPPVPRQPQVPLGSHRSAPQQSALVVHTSPLLEHEHVPSAPQRRTPQQSIDVWQD
jgi:hypothetical protein